MSRVFVSARYKVDPMTPDLFPHQHDGAMRLAERVPTYLGFDMGIGKTRTFIEAVHAAPGQARPRDLPRLRRAGLEAGDRPLAPVRHLRHRQDPCRSRRARQLLHRLATA